MMETNEMLSNYFDLTIPIERLYSKGEAIAGEHGIQEVDGEYYVSEWHLLKNGVAKEKVKAELIEFIDEQGDFSLSNKAKEECSDYYSWPQVVYSGLPNKKIVKYKLSWLIEAFIYPKNKFAKEIDILKKYLGPNAAIEFEKNVTNKTGITSRAKFNTIRVLLEALFYSMSERKLLPKVFVSPVSFPPILRFLGGQPSKGYQINYSSRISEIPLRSIGYLILIGNKGSHYDKKFNEYTQGHEDKFIRNAHVYLFLDVLLWYKDYIESEPIKEGWQLMNDVKRIEGVIKTINIQGNAFLSPQNQTLSDVFISSQLVEEYDLKVKDKIEVFAVKGSHKNFSAIEILEE